MKCEQCQSDIEVKKTSEGKHKDSHGKPLSCCDPKIKKPHLRYPLHAEHMLNLHGISAEEYDRISNSEEDFP